MLQFGIALKSETPNCKTVTMHKDKLINHNVQQNVTLNNVS